MGVEFLFIGLLGICVGLLGLEFQFTFEELRGLKSMIEELRALKSMIEELSKKSGQ